MARSVRLTGAEVLALAPHAIALRQTGQSYPGTALRRATDKIEQANGAPTKARPKRKPRPMTSARDMDEFVAKFSKPSSAPSRKAEKRGRRAAIREKVFARAAEGQPDGIPRCEGPANSNPLGIDRCVKTATELQHVFGRGKGRIPESERNCLAACHDCHLAETRNQPSGQAWWAYFAWWFWQHGFGFEAREAEKRRDSAELKGSLPSAPRTRAAETRAAYKRLEDMR